MIADELEEAFFRLMTQDVGNNSTVAFRNKIDEEVAKHLAGQLVRVALEIIRENGGV